MAGARQEPAYQRSLLARLREGRVSGQHRQQHTCSTKGKHLIASLTEHAFRRPEKSRSIPASPRRGLMLRCLLAALFMASSVAAHAGESAFVQQPNFKLDGRSAADLSAEWWKWAMSSPDEESPLRDTSGAHCDAGQQGKVWFLAGGFGSSLIRRRCTIPAGKYIFFPVISMAYWPQKRTAVTPAAKPSRMRP